MSSFDFSSPLKPYSRRLLLLGSGELGKELVIEAHKWGIETHAVARYEAAPATQVAHFHYVMDMMDPDALRNLVEKVKPTFIVPEIEAINIGILQEFENQGIQVVPSARAVYYSMDRERIRTLVSDKFKLITSNFKFASTYEEFSEAVLDIGFPCVVKPTMSSSGKGQSMIRVTSEIEKAWNIAHEECRGACKKVIIEKFIDFDYEITLMTVRHRFVDDNDIESNIVSFCPTIGHRQEGGDFAESWQPQPMNDKALNECKKVAKMIVDDLGGYGVYGVEFFIKGDIVYFSELSPRPHDTAFLTLKTQNMSQFELHIRAIIGFPIPEIKQLVNGRAKPIILNSYPSQHVTDTIILKKKSNSELENLYIYIFGKPHSIGRRRMGIIIKTQDR
jgi:phosphoribosylglycinamide formyltransferase 2